MDTDPTLGFGRYAGTRVSMLPSDYVLWIARPECRSEKTRDFKAPTDVLAACKVRADAIEAEKAQNLLATAAMSGKPAPGRGTIYVIERLGDLEDEANTVASTLEAALEQLSAEYPYGNPEDIGEGVQGVSRVTPDPEDDRILIWEVLETGHRRVVWHFSGWHWSSDEFAHLGQGRLPGDEDDLYSIALRD